MEFQKLHFLSFLVLKGLINDGETKEIIIIGNSELNVDSRGLSKFKQNKVMDFPSSARTYIVEKIDNILENRSVFQLFT